MHRGETWSKSLLCSRSALLAGGSLLMALQEEMVRAYLSFCSDADLLPVYLCLNLSPAKLTPENCKADPSDCKAEPLIAACTKLSSACAHSSTICCDKGDHQSNLRLHAQTHIAYGRKFCSAIPAE